MVLGPLARRLFVPWRAVTAALWAFGLSNLQWKHWSLFALQTKQQQREMEKQFACSGEDLLVLPAACSRGKKPKLP